MSEELLSGPPTRWTPKRKVRAILLVHEGQIPRHVALRLWEISEEEWISWERFYRKHGANGLRVTRIQRYRTRRRVKMNKLVIVVATSMFLGHAAHAQVTPGYGYGSPYNSQPRGFSVTTPGQPLTFVNPNTGGGYTVATPGQPLTFINPNPGGGYTVMTPGRPLTFIHPND